MVVGVSGRDSDLQKKTVDKKNNFSIHLSNPSIYYYSYIVYIGTEVVEVGHSVPGHVVQQLHLLAPSMGMMVTDLICCSICIDQFNGLSL